MKIRLYFPEKLQQGDHVMNSDVSHYLCRVLRVKIKSEVFLFNEHQGEWRGIISAAHPKQTRLNVVQQTRQPSSRPPLKLYFAPIKKSRISTIFAMATELGVTEIQPIKTRYTHNDVGRVEKIRLQLIEAAEQCERLDVPTLLPLQNWNQFMTQIKAEDTPLLACLERGDARRMNELAKTDLTPNKLLIGPEGGFSDQEIEALQLCHHCIAVTLGNQILRSETAVASALAQWHLCFGKS